MSSATSARNKSQVPQTTGDTQYNVRDAALRGASLAFSKPPVQPKPQTNTYTGGNNDALLAATKVGTGRNTPTGSTTPLRGDWTGGSTQSVGRSNVSPMRLLSHSSSSSTLAVLDDSQADRVPSPSNIAAKLAAARHTAMKPPPQAIVAPILSEWDSNERDVLPPSGSVGNVLARLDSAKPKAPRPQRRASLGSPSIRRSTPATLNDPGLTDATPIPPTTSLVKMFEHNRSATPLKASPSPLVVAQKAPPLIRSPKPQRKLMLPPEPKDDAPLERKTTRTPPPIKPKPKPQLDMPVLKDGTQQISSFTMLRKDTMGPLPARRKSTHLAAVESARPRPKPPLKREDRPGRPRSEDFGRSTPVRRKLSSSMSNYEVPSSPSSFVSGRESFVSAREEQEEEKSRPALPPPRRSRPKPEPTRIDIWPKPATLLPPPPRTASKMISPVPPPTTLSPPGTHAVSGTSTPTGTLLHSNYQRQSVQSITKHMTGESLSSAIVGAALASSRNASPNPPMTATPPIANRKQQHHHLHSPFHRSPSPPKPQPTGKLRTTLRKDRSSSSDEDESEKYKRKGTRIMGMGRKHPNKHHEGTRKRWRDQVTERERKRYEGVWAANKGLYILETSRSPSRTVEDDFSLEVHGLVAKEIWTRSRLPEPSLEEVWDLVDDRGIGRLRREEFVVGMWLIDQRLKGRKLPARVGESVWGSVRGAGVKIKVRSK